MDYPYDTFPFATESNLPYDTIPHPHAHHPQVPPHLLHPTQQQMFEAYYHAQPHHLQQPHYDYTDFHPQPLYHDDFEESAETMSRPRLTKEQVEILENQFQAHPKPNSATKRALAMRTNLTLPRVANWFQNRRAKAKQQRKQEEFEILQSMGKQPYTDESSSTNDAFMHPLSGSTVNSPERTVRAQESPAIPKSEPAATSTSPSSAQSQQQASYESLKRALAAAEAGRAEFEAESAMAASGSSPHQVNHHSIKFLGHPYPDQTDSINALSHAQTWPSNQPGNDGFDDLNITHMAPPEQSASLDELRSHLVPVGQTYGDALQSNSVDSYTQSIPVDPQYAAPFAFNPSDGPFSSQRRDSCADVTTSMGNIGLEPESQQYTDSLMPDPDVFKKPGVPLDIAARRNRPRPAALGTAALRSRSYAGPPSKSPTLRPPLTSPKHMLRQVKSTGGNLNVSYAGIRKSSSAQRSPLFRSSIANHDELHTMMSLGEATAQGATLAPPTPSSPEILLSSQPSIEYVGVFQEPEQEAQLQNYSNLQYPMQSPPSTPMMSENYGHVQMQLQAQMAPFSAPPQYAFFPEDTPQFSTGPPTTSSWADAPIITPSYSGVSPAIHMPQPTYVSPIAQDFAGFQSSQGSPPDSNMETPNDGPSKPTEFFIQEFPQQKEAHAHAAQQLAQQKPTNYSFSNQTPKDFSSPES